PEVPFVRIVLGSLRNFRFALLTFEKAAWACHLEKSAIQKGTLPGNFQLPVFPGRMLQCWGPDGGMWISYDPKWIRPKIYRFVDLSTGNKRQKKGEMRQDLYGGNHALISDVNNAQKQKVGFSTIALNQLSCFL